VYLTPVLDTMLEKALRSTRQPVFLSKHNGATLVIINREPTGLDPIADLVLNRAIGKTLGAAVGVA
jgi:hypothetical protein